MQLRNSDDGYGAIPQFLHWSSVALVAVAWLLGVFGDALPEGTARATGLFVHISVGLALLCVLLVRVLWRVADPPPPLERTALGVWLDRIARLAHYALYALLVAAPVVGILLQFARGDALPLFGLTEITSPWAADRAFVRSVKGVHEMLAHALVVLAVLHAAAALFHHWVLRDRTLTRMLPH
ncbi:cytochrome b/b6 domain-containing protein [Roseiarcaceae bacterium H3SJ34-1]|uniref:cytochrome b n=1 Tax=Terripilifer ovatus TaxID=3032367 RepID=UPI003AB97BCA|nr:cytochrome b/b6 domain-containing protein [Roseiarcaceae bacterium H3SJ34-1]